MSALHLTNGHAPSVILSIEESAKLRACETVIEKGLQTFAEVGNALLNIREARLYRQKFATFEDYCRERWEMSYRRSKQLMDAATVVSNLNNCSDSPPTHESQIRPLAQLEPDQQRKAWQAATESSPKPTAELVARMARRTIEADATYKHPSSYPAAFSAKEKEERRQAEVAQQEREIKARHLFIILGSLALGKQSPADTAADLLDYDEEAFKATQMPLTKTVWEKAIQTLKECAKQWEPK